MIDPQSIDQTSAAKGIQESLTPVLNDLLTGAAEDIQTFGHLIAQEMAIAVAAQKPALVEELKDQLLLLAEGNRLRAVHAKDDAMQETLGKTLDLVFNVASKVLLAATL